MRRDLASALLLGLALVGAGVLVSWRADTAPLPTGHGVASSAPLTATDAPGSTLVPGSGWAVTWTAGHLVGAVLAVVGLLVLAAAGGWALGRRSGRRPTAA